MVGCSASDVMSRGVVWVSPDESLLEARDRLLRRRITRLVVLSGGRVVGIITRKDIVRYLVERGDERSMDEIKVEDVMTRNPVAVPPTTPVDELARLMVERGFSSLIVVDGESKPLGIVTKSDLCRFYAEHLRGRHRVYEYMTPDPITVRPGDHIFRVACLMVMNDISRVVVVKNGKPVGIVSLSDLMAVGPVLKPLRGGRVDVREILVTPNLAQLLTASDVMTEDPITVSRGDDLADAARLMITHGISGLPVVNEHGTLVGIVTKTDVTRAISETRL